MKNLLILPSFFLGALLVFRVLMCEHFFFFFKFLDNLLFFYANLAFLIVLYLYTYWSFCLFIPLKGFIASFVRFIFFGGFHHRSSFVMDFCYRLSFSDLYL